jgi:hypothetical protein
LKSIKQTIEEIIGLERLNAQLALIEYRDHSDTNVIKVNNFTTSIQVMKGWFDNCSAQGGGDAPEVKILYFLFFYDFD